MDRVRTDRGTREVIEGVVMRQLVTHPDERGFFREVLRVTDDIVHGEFGQLSHSLMLDGVVKAWHLHKIQTDYFYVASGIMRVALYDTRPQSSTFRKLMDFLMGDHQPTVVVKIPPGVAHGCKVLQGPVHLVYLTSHAYNPNDELRLPHDDPEIGFDWLGGPKIT